MNRPMVIAAAMLLALLTGLAIGRFSAKDQAEAHRQRLLQLIGAQHRQIGDGAILVIGDSIVELQRLTRLCGRTTINAGISGARTIDLVEFAAAAIARARPSRVIFAIGTNDASDAALDLDTWRADTHRLVAAWPDRPVIVGLNRASSSFPVLVDQMNLALRGIATARGGSFADGLVESETYDGVHPSLAGSLAWQKRAEAACRKLDQPARNAAPNSNTGSSGSEI